MHGEARIGTSGFTQPELGGRSPGSAELLARYAQLLGAVEIGSSFLRLPSAEALSGWAAVVPAGFQFSLKLPRRISHELLLARAASRALAGFLEAVVELGPHLGPLLVQLPPDFVADMGALGEFLRGMPSSAARLAFEFRHPSWLTPATLRLLSAHEAALVVTDGEGLGAPRIELTANFAYVRIRADDQRGPLWEEWAARLAALTRRGVDVYAFVSHGRRGVAVDRARRLQALLRNEERVGEGQSLLT
jgi:uncharacterized protein YecE (DUF72 family)